MFLGPFLNDELRLISTTDHVRKLRPPPNSLNLYASKEISRVLHCVPPLGEFICKAEISKWQSSNLQWSKPIQVRKTL